LKISVIKEIGISCIFLILCISTANAAGSFSLATELMPVLNHKPGLKKSILDNFDLHETGSANRIGFRANERLAGKRIGPYFLKAKLKGKKSDFDLTIIVHTIVRFKDEKGNKTSLTNAYAVEESFHSYEVTDVNGQSAVYLDKNY